MLPKMICGWALALMASLPGLAQRIPSSPFLNINEWFGKADAFMDTEQYDSAQYWLNRISNVVGGQPQNIFGYKFLSRQSEVYYYNNLHLLGLQQSAKARILAESLNDSVLIADSYNFTGLFYLSMDSANAALPFFYYGLAIIPPPPYDDAHSNFSYPFHLMGNIAECHYRLGHYDSALIYGKHSFTLALEAKRMRAASIAMQLIGMTHLSNQQPDSAKFHLQKAVTIASDAGTNDVLIDCYNSLANMYAATGQYDSTLIFIKTGLDIIDRNPNINKLFMIRFLQSAYNNYQTFGENKLGSMVLDKLVSIQKASLNDYNKQMEYIITEGNNNEKRLLALEKEEVRRNRQWANVLMLTGLGGMAILVLITLLLVYRQHSRRSIANMRNKISRDLHDDIGASLSSLNIYSAIASNAMENEKSEAVKEMLLKIGEQSKEVLDNMDDIVWSLTTDHAKNMTIETRIKNYGSDMLLGNVDDVHYAIAPSVNQLLSGALARKNVWLICKELINNTAKYSEAKKASIEMYTSHHDLTLIVADDGVGYNVDEAMAKGNGLSNIQHRVADMHGTCLFLSNPGSGSRTIVTIPVNQFQ